jgi:hypothetical protein
MLMLECFAEFDVDWRNDFVGGWNPLMNGRLKLPSKPGSSWNRRPSGLPSATPSRHCAWQLFDVDQHDGRDDADNLVA